MNKKLFFFIACILPMCMTPFDAFCKDEFTLNGKIYACNQYNWGETQINAECGRKLQTRGIAKHNGTSYTNTQFECKCGSSDYWYSLGTNWCDDAVVRDFKGRPNLQFAVIDEDGVKHTEMNVAYRSGCLTSYCEKGTWDKASESCKEEVKEEVKKETKKETKKEKKKETKSNDYGGRTSTMGIACYKNGSFTKYDKVTDECKCINPNYEFKITDKYNAEGSCFPRPGTVPVSPATATAGGNPAAPALTDLEIKKKDCDSLFRSGLDVEWSANDQKCVCTDSNKYLTPSNTCEYTPAYLAGQDAERKESRVKIIAAGKVLNGIAETFDVSVWKNSDGGFNTARLASDGIAGVALGTVGGLITSNIIKKNQVKSGFEDIKCAIGGQVVADWGDEFDVGIR